MKDATQYAKTKWAEKLGVSTSGYYTWIHERDQCELANEARVSNEANHL